MNNRELKDSLAQFVTFARGLKGDEKSEAQAFLERFFRALGHAGVIEAGATFEFRIAKKPGTAQLELLKGEEARTGSGKKFADLLWPERVLIEMKSRGTKLEKSYDQAFEYWQLIVPNRPRYVILCDFNEFWIYDFNQQLFDPVERVFLRDLPDSISAFTFLLPEQRDPVFGNNRVEVTRKAADAFAGVFRKMLARGEDRARAQRFILQLLVSVVAEDLGLLPENIVTNLLKDSAERPGESYNLLEGLFRQMASPQPARGGRFAEVQYFNGGLFAVVDPIELRRGEAHELHEAALRNDWSKVKPEIFGTLFQQSMDAGEEPGTRDERHAFGAHFTSEFDIQKVVGPTIVRPWRERIEACGADKVKLRAALADLRRFRVLDPACGSGNFLFVAYRECKRLERDLLARLQRAGAGGTFTSEVALSQFYGLDILAFAAELAKVTLMLAKELEIREAQAFGQAEDFFVEEKALPLENLDQNIVCADALFTPWPAADAIIGNPPFQSKNKMQQEFGAAYVRKVRGAYPNVPGRADFCVYWLRKAHDHLQPGHRAGIVGTNTIRQNYSREGGLDHIVDNGGVITDAVSTEVWSGDAAVHISIVNWIKQPAEADVPKERTLTLQRGARVESPWETFKLPRINSALSVGVDVTNAIRLTTNANAAACFQGLTHGHEGFALEPDDMREMIRRDPRSAEVIFPYLTFDEMISNLRGEPNRFVIDLQPRNVFEAGSYSAIMDHLRGTVLPKREKAARKENERNAEIADTSKGNGNKHHANFLKRWWLLSYGRAEMLSSISSLSRYIVCGQNPARNILEFLSPEIRPNAQLIVFPFADDYSYGVLQSEVHWEWFKARCSTLGTGFRYTSDTVFDTFPWPQSPTRGPLAAVAAAAVALRALRREVMAQHDWSLRDLYRTLKEPGDNPLRTAQARLDTAVRAAYGMPAKADPLAFLLALNLELAAKEKAGEPITPPGLPLPESDRASFITEDCISVPPA